MRHEVVNLDIHAAKNNADSGCIVDINVIFCLEIHHVGWLSLEGIQRNLWTHHQVWVLPLICFVSISFETVLFDGQQTWLGGNPSCSSWMFHQSPCWLPEVPVFIIPGPIASSLKR